MSINDQASNVKSTVLFLAFSLTIGIVLPAHADLVLSGTPSAQDRTELNKRYEELAIQLTQALGEPVRYVPPANVQGYAQEIRKGTYDILIDGPHLGAWRISHGLHKPVAQADIALTFLVATPAADNSVQSLEQLVGKPVCVPPPPQLSTLMFFNQYPNPMQLPVMSIAEGYQPQVIKLFNGECKAAVISATFYERILKENSKNKLRVIFNTKPLPGYVMTASDKLSTEKREALTRRLTSAPPAQDPLLQALTKASVRDGEPDKMRWLPVETASIKNLENLLVEQSYGWQ